MQTLTEETRQERIARELEEVREKHGGILRAEDVVKYARAPKRALHKEFCWDDTEAARRYRLVQAREIIRVTVTEVPSTNRTTRAYVSLYEDREQPGGGYRPIESVMRSKKLRAALLAQVGSELKRMAERYRELEELAPVWSAIDVLPFG